MSASASPAPDVSVGALPPRSWSVVGWAVIAVFSVFLTYLITVLLGLFFLGFGCLLVLGMLRNGPSFVGLILATFSLVVGVTMLWSLLPRKDAFEPNGILLDLSRETRLRTELETIAHAMGEPMPSEIYLIPEANAAVLEQRGRMGSGARRIMLLGLPLMQMLSVSQFRAILAHEFAHFFAGDTRFGPWVFKARSNMARVLISLGQESFVLGVLRKWVIIALLHMVIMGGLVLYWKLFNRLTQYISRRQEFRCDELACYFAGSRSLEQGLCNVSRAAATFGVYCHQVVVPVAAGGFCPQLADGFARFVNAPAIVKAASDFLEKRLTAGTTDPLDSHPPLNDRIQKALALAIPSRRNDERRAITLIDNLQSIELQFLQKLAPGIKTSELKAMHWDSAGLEVYIPLWRRHTAQIQSVLGQRTVANIPDILSDLPAIAGRIPDPPGTLLTREQRSSRAADALSYVLTLALVDNGWRLHLQPGQFHLEKDDRKLEPASLMAGLRSGNVTKAGWIQYCDTNSIGSWPLAPALAAG